MNIERLLGIHDETCRDARAIMVKKNHDYTNGSVDPFANFRGADFLGITPEEGIMLRAMDKFKRIQTFVRKGTLEVNGEGWRDAVQDVVNYMVLLKGMLVEREENAADASHADEILKHNCACSLHQVIQQEVSNDQANS
jgi:hypothetical protein